MKLCDVTRDFFYVQKYERLRLGRVCATSTVRLLITSLIAPDLNYVIGEMIAELSVSHAYIAGGDFEIPQRPQVALPGARIELDAAAGRYRVVKIYKGQNEEEIYRSPLTRSWRRRQGRRLHPGH